MHAFMRPFSKTLSVLLHPLLMPLFATWLALELDPHLGYFLPPQARWLLLGMLAIMTIGFPLTSILLLLRAGLISSLEMPVRQERIAPFAMTLVYYGLAYYLLRKAPLHPAVHGIFLGVIAALTTTLIITLRWKISVHMVGIGGVIGAVIGIGMLHALPLIPLVAALVLLAGVLGTARLFTSDHTQAQVIAGTVLGTGCTCGAVLLGWTI